MSFQQLIRAKNLIHDKWVNGEEDAMVVVKDKYTGDELTSINNISSRQIEETVGSSQKAFVELRNWSAEKRAKHLEKLISLLKEQKPAFTDLIIREAGKPLSYAKVEVERAISTLEFAARACYRQNGNIIPIDYGSGTNKTALTKKKPIGIVLGVTPFNFPLNLLLHKVAPALATGCPVIVKPSPHTPATALAFGELIQKADYPPGTVNVILCNNENTTRLVADDRISMLSFTGSDAVGWLLKSKAGKKRVTLELGGNASVIVDTDVKLATVAREIVKGAFLYSGQICISTQRIIALDSIYDELVVKLCEEINKIKTGDPKLDSTLVGPLIDRNSLLRVDEWVDEAQKQDAIVLTGGKILDETKNLYAPTLLSNVSNQMKIVSEEVFGPVAVMQKATSFSEAIDIANDSRYGLQAGVYTEKIKHVKQAHDQLEVGAVIINSVPGFRMDNMPYGGIKDSGIGKEGIEYAMDEMQESKLLIY